MKISRFPMMLLFMMITVPLFTGCSDIAQLPTGTPPTAPVGATAEAGDGQVRLSWLPVAGARYYNVYHHFAMPSGLAGKSRAAAEGIAGTSVVVSGLANATPYYFVIRGVNEYGESAGSVPVSATPTSARHVTAVPPAGNGRLTLSWEEVTGATSYNIYYDMKPGVTRASPANVLGVTETSHTLTGLIPGTTYYFVVTSVDRGTEGAESREISATPRYLHREP